MERGLHIVAYVAALVAYPVVTWRTEGRDGGPLLIHFTHQWSEPSVSKWGCSSGVQPANFGRCWRVLKRLGFDINPDEGKRITNASYPRGCSYQFKPDGKTGNINWFFNDALSGQGMSDQYLVCSINLKSSVAQMRYLIGQRRAEREKTPVRVCQNYRLTTCAFDAARRYAQVFDPRSLEARNPKECTGQGDSLGFVTSNSETETKTENEIKKTIKAAYNKWKETANVKNSSLQSIGYALYHKPDSATTVHSLYFAEEAPVLDSLCFDATTK